jgi:anaerobic magnesium-protoporphyrin IX monomethyl ester cyclase
LNTVPCKIIAAKATTAPRFALHLVMNKVLLFNPRSAVAKCRIPNSVLSIAAAVNGLYHWAIVDGNRETDPWQKLEQYLLTGQYKYIGFTVMPGPQLKQAIPFAKKIKEQFPETIMIWGGYFSTNQHKVVLQSGYVDFVVNGPGDNAFPNLIQALDNNHPYELIKNIIYHRDGRIVKTIKEDLLDQDTLKPLPFEQLDTFYSIDKYLGKTCLGNKTLAYHASVGCPFTCSFCAVVPIYEARWKGKSAGLIYKDVKHIKETWGADAIEFHDNNFFVSEKRTAEFCRLIMNDKMTWWGEGRIDTINKYSDETLDLMRQSGCKMIFFGAETGNDEILKQMDKGGTQTSAVIKSFAVRMARFGIIPEYSFVLGTPAATPEKAMKQIDNDIAFIKEIKTINPETEIIIYTYSPVPTEGSDMYNEVLKAGFSFPQTLEDWISPHWENFDLRKNPLTPWLTPAMINKIRDFETVLNSYYPTVSDIKLTGTRRKLMRLLAAPRYKTGFNKLPYELKALQRLWRYRQPEIEGF